MTSPSPPSLAGPSDPPPSSIEVHNSSASIPPSISVDGHPIGRTMRVSQLDSSDLDDALVGMLGTRVADSLDNFGPSFKLHFQPELYLLINLLLYRFGMWNRLTTPGAQLQNLKYTSTRLGGPSQSRSKLRNLLLLNLLLTPSIFPKYLLTRFKQYALSRSWPDLPRRSTRKRIWDLMSKLEDLGKLGELVGMVWFLGDGQYPSLLTRLLGLKLVPSQPILSRMVSYEFMNRQLVWGSFAQFLPHFLPLLTPLISHLPTSLPSLPALFPEAPPDYHALSKTLPHSSSSNASQSDVLFSAADSDSGPSASASTSARVSTGPYATLPLTTCPICYSNSPNPSSSLPPSLAGLPPLPDLPRPPTSNQLSHVGPADPQGVTGDVDAEPEDDPNAIHVPVTADCWGKCAYCYFCLGEAIVRAEAEARRKREMGGLEKGWGCLRCGGEVWGFERVQAKEEEEGDGGGEGKGENAVDAGGDGDGVEEQGVGSEI